MTVKQLAMQDIQEDNQFILEESCVLVETEDTL